MKKQVALALLISAVLIVLGAILITFSWGMIPGLVLIAVGIIIGIISSTQAF